MPLPVVVKLFPGPATLLDAWLDLPPGVSFCRGAGAWFLRVVIGYGSVLKSLSRFPVAFSWIRPGSPRYYAAGGSRGLVLYLSVPYMHRPGPACLCPWLLVVPCGVCGPGFLSSFYVLTWSWVSRWRRPSRRLCAGFLYAWSLTRRWIDIPFGRLVPVPWVCFVLVDLWPSCGVFDFACWVPGPHCHGWFLGFVFGDSLWFQLWGSTCWRHRLFQVACPWAV